MCVYQRDIHLKACDISKKTKVNDKNIYIVHMQKYMIKNLMNQNYYFITTKSMKNEAW